MARAFVKTRLGPASSFNCAHHSAASGEKTAYLTLGLRLVSWLCGRLGGHGRCSFGRLARRGFRIHHCLELRASAELWHCGCRNLQLLTSAWVFACASCALRRLESSETNEGHGVALLDRRLDRVNDGVQHLASGSLGEFMGGRDFFDEFGAIHFFLRCGYVVVQQDICFAHCARILAIWASKRFARF